VAAVTKGAAIQARVDAHLDLVRRIATRLHAQLPGHFEVDDLVGDGTAGLIQAAERYDERSGTPFSMYAYHRIRGAMLDGVRRMGLRRSQVERYRAEERVNAYLESLAARDEGARQSGAPEATLEDDLRSVLHALQSAAVSHMVSMDAADAELAARRPGPEESLVLGESRERVKAAVATLPDREQTFIRKMYYEDKSLTEAASEVGISKSWASRLHARAVELLRAALAAES
jgi:RNA polymerase sigma factor FliA